MESVRDWMTCIGSTMRRTDHPVRIAEWRNTCPVVEWLAHGKDKRMARSTRLCIRSVTFTWLNFAWERFRWPKLMIMLAYARRPGGCIQSESFSPSSFLKGEFLNRFQTYRIKKSKVKSNQMAQATRIGSGPAPKCWTACEVPKRQGKDIQLWLSMAPIVLSIVNTTLDLALDLELFSRIEIGHRSRFPGRNLWQRATVGGMLKIQKSGSYQCHVCPGCFHLWQAFQQESNPKYLH